MIAGGDTFWFYASLGLIALELVGTLVLLYIIRRMK